MQQLIDALVEERFASGLREGAADLAQAIREVAPRSDAGPPRTMHTERPVTLMTRSLLRDMTPAHRPSRPSQPPPAAAAPELPSSDEFAVRPTIALAVPAEPPDEEFPPIPSSGAQTMARMVDQLALAQAAQAMLAAPVLGAFNPSALRADGTPMPPFRVSYGDVRGEELASVVGGHTLSHGAGLAVESRGHRWTIIVLGLAALIGVIAAIVIQLTPSERVEPAPERVPPAVRSAEDPPGQLAAAPAAPARREAPEAIDERELAPRVPPSPQAQPTFPAPAPAAPGAQDPAKPGGPDPTPDPRATEPPVGAPSTGDAKSAGGQAADGKTGDVKTADARTVDARTVDARTVDARTGDGRSTGRRSAGGRDTGKHKGILTVQSTPWSWVTVDVETKETPAKFYLDPGVHTVKFYNEDNGRTEYAKVTIEPDKLYRLDKDMD
jgi:hypothetical protein